MVAMDARLLALRDGLSLRFESPDPARRRRALRGELGAEMLRRRLYGLVALGRAVLGGGVMGRCEEDACDEDD
jgi:hypothetical protein